MSLMPYGALPCVLKMSFSAARVPGVDLALGMSANRSEPASGTSAKRSSAMVYSPFGSMPIARTFAITPARSLPDAIAAFAC